MKVGRSRSISDEMSGWTGTDRLDRMDRISQNFSGSAVKSTPNPSFMLPKLRFSIPIGPETLYLRHYSLK